jgi:hypothetical protein
MRKRGRICRMLRSLWIDLCMLHAAVFFCLCAVRGIPLEDEEE